MKKAVSFVCAMSIIIGCLSCLYLLTAFAQNTNKEENNFTLDEIPLILWYDEEAPYGEEDISKGRPENLDDGWERWSIPLGNGYFGANVFGRTSSERIQLSEKTLSNAYYDSKDTGGWNNFSETYIDFGHPFEDVTDYSRSLDLKTAISEVDYVYDGVRYQREYFTSYEDYCMVIKLTADTEGKLSFTLRPTIPYLQDFAYHQGNPSNTAYYEVTKHGNVTSSVGENGAVINLSGRMGQFSIDFEAEYRIFTDGLVSAGNWTHTYNTNVVEDIVDEFNSGVRNADDQTLTVTNGTLEVSEATEAYIVITLGTNYDQSKGEENSTIYTTGTYDQKLSLAGVDAKAANQARMTSALNNSFSSTSTLAEGYENLKNRHLADYSNLFGRASLILETDKDDLNRTTDELLERYKADEGNGNYLETLIFQYGRYLMIASSRENSLPSNLQGVWNRYNYSAWGAGMTHNINEQMNYWAAFSTGLEECFEAYVNLSDAYMEKARSYAASILRSAPFNYTGTDTGIAIALNITPYAFRNANSDKNAGPLGLTTQMFWDYYLFTADEEILADTVYPILYEAAQFITKTVAYNESEDAYLSIYSDSPEQKVDGEWYFTEGTTYAQSFAYLNNIHLLQAAEILGYEDDELLTEVRRQIDKYDAIVIGLSGQVKEFREEDYYGDLGQYNHRHTSQLLGLYPGELINAKTDAWIDAAKVTLTERGDFAGIGWARALAISLWARTGSADEAHEVLGDLIKNNMATNLWTLHPPFQIDANFGTTAGITEMLLQSHNGYIEPLAALPQNWANGSYEGLLARGNFTVDVTWRNGSATEITILSGKGGQCKILLEGIGNANIVDSNGNQISYVCDELDLISFNTEAGESYTITNIEAVKKAAPAADLTVLQTSKNNFDLGWQASADAVSYNVYKAIESASSYTLIANTDKCSYTYTTSTNEENLRTTYRVCAVDENGRESEGVLCYVNPLNTEITDVQATILANEKLQVLISTEATVSVYTLYEYDTETKSWTNVKESEHPVIILDGYDAGKRYAISVTSGYFPSELCEILKVDIVDGLKAVYEEDTSINVFEGVTESDLEFYSPDSKQTLYADFPLIKAFDGNTKSSSSRWAVKSVQNVPYSVTVTLKQKQVIKSLLLYDFRNSDETESRSDDTMVEVYNNGVWTTVLSGVVLERVEGTKYCKFDLGFVEAEKVRMTFKNTQSASSATIYEVIGTGAKVSYVPTDEIQNVEDTERNIFEGIEDSDIEFSSSGGLYVYSNLPLINGFDGDLTTRWATNGKQNAPYTLTIALNKTEKIKTLRFYDFRESYETSTRSNNTKVEVYLDGVWTTVIEGASLDRTPGTKYCELDLNYAEAEKVRITFENTAAATCATIYELTGTGAKAISVDRSALLEAILEAEKIDTSCIELISKIRLEAAYREACAALENTESTANEIMRATDTLNQAILALPEGKDLDLTVTEDLKDGSGYPTTAYDYITNVGGIGGKASDDLAYKLSGSGEFIFNFTRSAANYAKDFVLEFNVLLDEGATFAISNKINKTYTDGALGAAAWGGPALSMNGSAISIGNGTVIAVNGVSVNENTTALCEMSCGKWYKVAFIVPITTGEATEYVYFVINGTVYTVKVTTPFYGLTYPQFRKENATEDAIYLDNIVQKNGTSAIYVDGRDALNDLSAFDSEEFWVNDGVIYTANKISVGEIKALVNDNIRVFTDSTFKTEVNDLDCLNGGEIVVAYATNGRNYERTYTYYVMAPAPDGYVVASFYDSSNRVANVAVPIGQTPVAPSVKEVIAIDGVGYRFIGWSNTEGSDVVTELGSITIDASYYAVRVPVTYKVEKADGSIVWYSDNLTLSEIISESTNGDTITMCADVDIDSVIYLDKSITLDLDGNKMTTTSYIVPSNGAYVTICNGTVDITVREVAQMYETKSADATLVLHNVVLTKGADAANRYVIDSRAGSVVMNAVTVNENEWNIPSSSASPFITVGYKSAKVAQSIKFTFKDCNITLPKITLITGTGASGETNGYALDIDVIDSYICAGSYVLDLQPVSTARANCWLDISIDGKSTMLTNSGFTNQVMFKINPDMNGDQVVVWANYGVVFSKLPRLATGTVLLGDGDAMLEYDDETSLGYVKDVWAEGYTPVTDYDYSFCLVGDTQMTVNYDPSYLNILYDWIVANKESKNIQYVFGLGDITNHSTDNEWKVAYNEIIKLNGVVNYSLIRGNHDTSEGLNATFNNAVYKSMFDGFFSEDLIENAYVAFTVGNVKYLHVTLDCGASDAVLSWASEIISQYPDHRVIISTHSYLTADGGLITERESANGTSNSGVQMWNKLISQHENIFLVLSGHVFSSELVCVQTEGVHGNIVTQIVANGQTYDYRNGAMGLVAMLYFSKDGKTVDVEYYSTVYDKYLGPNSQFTIAIPEYVSSEPTVPEYLYSITHSNGTVDYYDSSYAFSDIMTTYASNGCTVNVYGDVSINANFKVQKRVTLNLNGHTLSSDGGSIQGGNNTLSITNGKMSVTNKNVIYIGEGYPATVINLSDIEIYHTTAAGTVTFADVRGGELSLDNVNVASGAWNNVAANFISCGYKTTAVSRPINVSIANSSINLGSGSAKLILYTGASGQTNGWIGDFMISNSTISLGSGCVVQASPTSGAAGNCGLNIVVDGRSTVIASTFFNISNTISAEKVNIIFDIGAKFSYIPEMNDFTISYSGGVVAYDSESGLYVVRSKSVPAITDFVPKTSITLGSELVYNIYVPVVDSLKSFTVDGKTYANLNPITLDDGKQYYRIAVSMPASTSARNIVLKATVTVDGKDYNGTWSMNIPKYSKKVLESDASDIEKTLVKDVLAYIKAAYIYFNADDKTEVAVTIDEILGDYNNTFAKVEGTTNTDDSLWGIVIALEEKPAIRFVLPNGVTADNYTFKSGNRTLEYTVGTRTIGENTHYYAEVSLFAYQMINEITYTDGTNSGTWHINSYYDFVTTDGELKNDENLITLVEKLYNYCKSARDYKNSVTIKVNYVDESGSKLLNSKTVRTISGASYTFKSPSVEGYYTRDLYVDIVATEDQVVNVVYKPIPTNADEEKINEYLSDIIAWGDSITAGAHNNDVTSANEYGIDLVSLGSTANGGTYTSVLKSLIASNVYAGISVNGCGVGGEATSTIAARADAETYYLYLSGDVTISSSPVVVPLTHYASVGRVGILRQGGSAHVNPVTIVGKDINGNDISVSGTLSLALTADAPSGTDIKTCDYKYLQYTFTRDDGKIDELSFVSGARVITKASYIYDGRTCIIFMGQNGGYSDIAELIKQQEEILKACGNPEFYLIISTTSGSYESRTEIRNALSARWGDRYINMGDEINSQKAYELAGYSEEAIASVAGNIATGTVSTLLIKDTCHPNAVGYAVIGNVIFERLFRIGAFDALYDYYDSLNS